MTQNTLCGLRTSTRTMLKQRTDRSRIYKTSDDRSAIYSWLGGMWSIKTESHS
jgi:hypothetical protein